MIWKGFLHRRLAFNPDHFLFSDGFERPPTRQGSQTSSATTAKRSKTGAKRLEKVYHRPPQKWTMKVRPNNWIPANFSSDIPLYLGSSAKGQWKRTYPRKQRLKRRCLPLASKVRLLLPVDETNGHMCDRSRLAAMRVFIANFCLCTQKSGFQLTGGRSIFKYGWTTSVYAAISSLISAVFLLAPGQFDSILIIGSMCFSSGT